MIPNKYNGLVQMLILKEMLLYKSVIIYHNYIFYENTIITKFKQINLKKLICIIPYFKLKNNYKILLIKILFKYYNKPKESNEIIPN